MDPLRTPDFASESARRAVAVSAAHREESRGRDRADSRSVSERQFRVSAWDPCYDVSVGTALRSADHAMVARTPAVYARKDDRGSDYTQPAGEVSGSISSSYPSAKIGHSRASSSKPPNRSS